VPADTSPRELVDPGLEPSGGAPAWYGAAARGMAPQPLIQSGFMLVYSVWWVFAWPGWGTGAFTLMVVLALGAGALGVRNLRHARKFENIESEAGLVIGKRMTVLSAVSYGTLWLAVIALSVLGQPRWILPVVALIIALHFFPLAWIFHRRIDLYLAPVALVFSAIGLYLATQAEVRWEVVYAVTGVGGALCTGVYAMYMLRQYTALARSANVTIR